MTNATAGQQCAPPVRTRQQGAFCLPLAAQQAFDLFTAEGERRWVPGWEPVFLSSCGGNEAGAVFLTDHGGEQTIWTLIEADRERGKLLYSRVSPGRRAGTVRVEIEPISSGSEIAVSYDLTALGPDGEVVVRTMDRGGFATMLAQWRRMIVGSLRLED
jgi:hypothetical protein